jgi:hypothetical protein
MKGDNITAEKTDGYYNRKRIWRLITGYEANKDMQ